MEAAWSFDHMNMHIFGISFMLRLIAFTCLNSTICEMYSNQNYEHKAKITKYFALKRNSFKTILVK